MLFMAASSIVPQKLNEYPQHDVIDGSGGDSAAILDDCLNHNGGVLPLDLTASVIEFMS